MTDDPKKQILAILYASGEPVSPERIAEALETEAAQIKRLVRELAAELEAQQSPLEILCLESSFQLATRPAYAPVIRRRWKSGATQPLSRRRWRCWPSSPTTSRHPGLRGTGSGGWIPAALCPRWPKRPDRGGRAAGASRKTHRLSHHRQFPSYLQPSRPGRASHASAGGGRRKDPRGKRRTGGCAGPFGPFGVR